MTEKEDKFEDKADEKTYVLFAKECDFSFKSLEGLTTFFESLRDFSHHLSENHYYSDNINKKVMGANLELHSLALELHQLDAEANPFFATANKAILAAKTPEVDKKKFADFKQRLETAATKVYGLNASLRQLVEEIKREYGEKV